MHRTQGAHGVFVGCFHRAPPGYGALDEFFEIVTWAQLHIHSKPCVLINTDGYYDFLLRFLDHAMREEFVRPTNLEQELVQVARTPRKLCDELNHSGTRLRSIGILARRMAPGSRLNHHEPERLMLGAQMGTSAMDSRTVFKNSACLRAAALSIHRRIKRASAERVLASLQTNDLLHARCTYL